MEENSDSPMETDVSSTTQDIPLPEEVPGPSGSMEVTVEIAETTEEEEEMVTEEQDKRIDSNTPEKVPSCLSVDQKLPPTFIVIKKNKNPVKSDSETSPQRKDPKQSPSKVPVLKNIQSPVGKSQPHDTAKKSPEKPYVVTKAPEKVMPVVLVKSKNDKTFIVQKSPKTKDHKHSTKDLQSPKILEQVSTAPAQKTPKKHAEIPSKHVELSKKPIESPTKQSPTKHVEPPSKHAESPTKLVESPTKHIESPTKKSESPINPEEDSKTLEKMPDKEPLQNIPNQDVSLQPLLAENPTAKQDKKAEILNKEEVTVSVEPQDYKEISDDSQTESVASNKSISRELRSLINSAKESKIISECTQVKTKTRKSRSLLDTSNVSLNTSIDPEKVPNSRRGSCNSQESSSSEKSEKVSQQRVLKLRSQSKTPSRVQKEAQDGQLKSDVDKLAEKLDPTSVTVSVKVKSGVENDVTSHNKLRSDPYCWRCHYAVELAPNEHGHPPARCTVCPRSFHYKCLTVPERSKLDKEVSWVCPKCMTILHAESSETRSPVMKKTSLGMLCDLLKHALQRMTEVNGVEPFLSPVDRAAFPDYDKYVVHAVDLGLMKESINAGVYGSTEAFVSDAQWILHNSIIFNTPQSKLTAAAKALVRACRAEMSEIEACPECYGALRAGRYTWFTDVCSSPHILLWAKLKGFPYWPAKGMSVNSSGMVDARFFGAHDRAWVPARDCFLYSERDPNAFRTKRQDIVESMQEAEQHIRNISRKFGKFVYPAFKVPFEPTKLNEQIKMMIPNYEPDAASPKQKPSATPSPASKGRSKADMDACADESLNDDEAPPVEKKRKKSFVEIEVPAVALVTEKSVNDTAVADQKTAVKTTNKPNLRAKSVEPEKLKKVDEKEKSKETTRKRRRSVWEEATMTIMSPEPAKRQKTAKLDTPDKTKPKASDSKDENKAKEATEVVKALSKTRTSSPKPIPVETLKENKESTSTPLRSTRTSTPASVSEQANKQTPVVNTPKEADKVKKAKAAQREKSTSSEIEKEKDDKQKPKRDRTSKGNKSQNSTPKSAKKKSDRENSSSNNESDSNKDKNTSASKPKAKSLKNALLFDEENTTLALLSRQNSLPVLPTISNVRSLSSKADFTKKASITEASSESSIFTPTSTDNVNTMKDAVAKLQKLRDNEQPIVGRVGVRSFARMTSPPAAKDAADSDQVEVEVKAEPMDVEDAERQSEKIDFANTIRLKPVNPQIIPSLRDLRITKVSTAGATTSTATLPSRKQIVIKPKDVRPKARKTFPQPQKANDGRSELNSKNSMVYIPIQPPLTQAPVPVRPPVRIYTSTSAPNTPPLLRPQMTVASTSSNNAVNTMTTPLVVPMSNAPSMPTLTQVPSVGQMGSLAPLNTVGQVVPQVGQVPTTVHTVPLITSVNGQWTFSLQPMMSVGGVDPSTPPLSNGVPEPAIAPIAPLPAPPALNATPVSNASSKNSDGSPAEMPRLQQKPAMTHPLDPNAPSGSELPTPSSAGPITAKFNQNATKLVDFFRTLLEDSIDHLDYPAAMITSLKKEIERMQWRYKQQVDELKHNHELQLAEMRSTFEKEKLRLASDTRRSMQFEISNAVKHAKSRQWCAQCQQEAQFYCCWNTSYCDYPCQREHWAQHYSVCTQQRSQDNGNGTRDSIDRTEDRLQPTDKPPALQKPAVGATVTVGGKLIQSRLVCQNSSNQIGKPSIIVSMVEDSNGFKPVQTTTQAPSLLINKQLMNAEDSTGKKVVTSGGYLILGATNSTNSSVVIN